MKKVEPELEKKNNFGSATLIFWPIFRVRSRRPSHKNPIQIQSKLTGLYLKKDEKSSEKVYGSIKFFYKLAETSLPLLETSLNSSDTVIKTCW